MTDCLQSFVFPLLIMIKQYYTVQTYYWIYNEKEKYNNTIQYNKTIYDNKTALLKTVLKTVMDPPGGLNYTSTQLIPIFEFALIVQLRNQEATQYNTMLIPNPTC